MPLERSLSVARASRRRYRALLSSLLAALCGCSGDTTSSPGGGTPTGDACGNAIGNGAQLVAGPSGPSGSDLDRPFGSLAIAPDNPDVVFVGTERNGFVRSRDGGRTWQRLRSGVRHSSVGYPEIYDISIAPGNANVLMAASRDSPGPLSGDYPSAIAGAYRSVNGGEAWTRTNCGLPGAATVAVQIVDASGASAVMAVSAGTATFSPLTGQQFPGGLFRTTDGGANWTAASSPVSLASSQFNVFRLVPATGELFTFAFDQGDPTRSIGFLRSSDGGASWTRLANPMSGRLIAHFDVSADGRTIWADADDDFRAWRSTDGGATWAVTGGFVANGVLSVSPLDPALLLIDDFGTLRRSSNALSTTQVVVSSTQPFEDVSFAPSNASIVYAVTRGYDIYRSADAGQTFERVSNLRDVALH